MSGCKGLAFLHFILHQKLLEDLVLFGELRSPLESLGFTLLVLVLFGSECVLRHGNYGGVSRLRLLTEALEVLQVAVTVFRVAYKLVRSSDFAFVESHHGIRVTAIMEVAVIVTSWRVADPTDFLSVNFGPDNILAFSTQVVFENLEVDIVCLAWNDFDGSRVGLSLFTIVVVSDFGACFEDVLSDGQNGHELAFVQCNLLSRGGDVR